MTHFPVCSKIQRTIVDGLTEDLSYIVTVHRWSLTDTRSVKPFLNLLDQVTKLNEKRLASTWTCKRELTELVKVQIKTDKHKKRV